MRDEPAIWQPTPDAARRTAIWSFMETVADRTGLPMSSYDELYRWSVETPATFWSLLWDFCPVIGNKGECVVEHGDDMRRARWFPEATLNFAENLLCRRDRGPALLHRTEQTATGTITSPELYRRVAAVAAWLRSTGVDKGDRVAGYLPNGPEAIIAMLATTSIGAVWTATSPDFGVDSVVERFSQTNPKVMIAATGYHYNGTWHDTSSRVAQISDRLGRLERLVVVADGRPGPAACSDWQELLDTETDGAIAYAACSFNDPLYILYSSGTTGTPKCIVHSVGGTLLQHLKEHRLHCDIRPGDRVFYFTTCGWMMWNWLASVLASEAAIVLFDGSPFHPDPHTLWHYAAETGVTLFGTSAKYLDSCKKSSLSAVDRVDLTALRTICSTGSVLAPETYDYVYRSIKTDVCLASISGGTDIVSCFVLGCPILPVYRGEIQCRGLAMAVEVFDAAGASVVGQKGELVCTAPFPSQPLGFWGDADGSAYHRAYFARYDKVWHHGDFALLTGRGTVIIYGRSDATLNPGGVRIGTAEIYRHVEQLDDVVEAVAIGQHWRGDTRLVLFVVLRQETTLTDELRETIRRVLRRNCSPRHVPSRIVRVAAIPRTKSGKLAELAVRDVVHDRPVENIGALANPESLEQFRNRAELRD